MKKAIWAAASALMAFGGAAMAADDDKQGDLNFHARAGVGGFTGGLDDYTSAGPTWGVGFSVQPYRVLGIEVNYEGSRNQLADDRLANTSALMRHGASAMLKLAPPFIERIKPFAGVGLGASYINADNDTSGLYKSDFVQEIPLAAGLEFNSGAVSAGFRATYRFLLDEAFADNAQTVGNPEGGLFDATVTVGARF